LTSAVNVLSSSFVAPWWCWLKDKKII
jgi:hypothetical protein